MKIVKPLKRNEAMDDVIMMGTKKNRSIQHDKSSENMIKTFFIASFNHHSQMLTLQMTSLL